MSVSDFMSVVRSDPKLRQELEAIDLSDRNRAYDRVVEVAGQRGYSFTREDLDAAVARRGGALTDEEMNNVAGGNSLPW